MTDVQQQTQVQLQQLACSTVPCASGSHAVLAALRLLLQVRKGNRSQSFYTMPEYEAWRESLANTRDANGWDIKYYKGAFQ
jgi:hypothetical protein